jgi:hypothetical protein
MNKDINIELLNNNSDRLLNFLRKHSNLIISTTKHYNICVSHKDNWSSNIIFKSDLNNVQPIVGITYSFLMNHKDDTSFVYCYSSIFKYAETCRNYFVNILAPRCIKANTISYEICHSEAGQVIKSLGFPTSLEELAIKMDLMGI